MARDEQPGVAPGAALAPAASALDHLDPSAAARELERRAGADDAAAEDDDVGRAAGRRGALALGQEFVNESVIGTRFSGRLVEETVVGGRPAVVPEITGRAWVTGMGEYLLDATDPFPAGFAL